MLFIYLFNFISFKITYFFEKKKKSAVPLAFVSAIVDENSESVLTTIQLLWVSLIMNTMAGLALATERPSPKLLNRPPFLFSSSFFFFFSFWK